MSCGVIRAILVDICFNDTVLKHIFVKKLISRNRKGISELKYSTVFHLETDTIDIKIENIIED